MGKEEYSRERKNSQEKERIVKERKDSQGKKE